MKVAVRYCSKTPMGNTRKIADAMADALGVTAVNILDEPQLNEPVDFLFLGGAPYANIMAPELRRYAEELDRKMADHVVLFTTSNWSRRTVYALRKILRSKGMRVRKRYFYAHMLRVDKRLDAAGRFACKMTEHI